MMEALAAAESVLRDVLVAREGVGAEIVNADFPDVVETLSSATTSAGALQALEACRQAADNLAANVSPQLTLEVMLLAIKEAVQCPPSSR